MKSIFLMCALAVAAPNNLVLDGDAAVEVKARGPAGLNIHAKSSALSVDDAGDTFAVKVPVSSLGTGIDLRDSHMRKVLETDKFSDAVLVLQDSDLKRPSGDDTVGGSAPGKFTLHGVTKTVTVNYETVGDCEGHVGVRAKFSLEMPDFGVTPPSYLGMTIKPHVDVEARFRLKVAGQ